MTWLLGEATPRSALGIPGHCWKGSPHQAYLQSLPTSNRAREARKPLEHQEQEKGRQGQLARFVLGLYSHRDTWQLTLDKMSNKNWL